MQIETRIDAIEARAQRIGLSMTALAKKANVAASTIFRNRGSADNKLSTLEKLNAALVAEERRVLAHLLCLHPQNEAAAGARSPRPYGDDGAVAALPAVAAPPYTNGRAA